MRSSLRNLALIGAMFYLFLVAILFFTIRYKTNGHFFYALDDPYIHLALAENLAHGHYGINPAEFSSPSSSILWPFLLIPFAGTAFHAYVPLLWNIVFGIMAAGLIGMAVAKWPPQTDENERWFRRKQLTTVFLLVLVANLTSLTFIGMEHVLQILLAICCAIGAAEALSKGSIPRWCIVAAILAPMVRYEDLSLTVAICFALAGLRQWRQALAVLGVSLVPLFAFSIFLHSKGLPLLPMSVLVKGGAYNENHNLFIKVYKLVRQNIYLDLKDMDHFAVVVFFLTFAVLTWQARSRVRRFVFAGATFLSALQLIIGRFGWFGRYEVYAVIFLTMLCLYVLSERPPFLFGFFVLGLVFCAVPYIHTTEFTVSAAQDVYRNEYQMHRFVTEFYQGDYAVNDLGLVSFQRRPGAYVLDVYGLASPEASRQTHKTAAWLEQIVNKHGVKLAMLFPEWFQIPQSWTPVARMCEPGIPIVLPDQCMVFYSTSPEAEPAIRGDLERFAPTLPKDVLFSFDPDRAWGGILPPTPPK